MYLYFSGRRWLDMTLPNGIKIIARLDGGSRNHINLASMFGNDCKEVTVEFLVVEKNTKQGIYRIDSEPEPLEKVISPFSDSRYFVDQAKDQFIPIFLPSKKMGLFDCRSAKNVLKNYDEIEIIRSIKQEDNFFRKNYYERSPRLCRAILCKVKRNDKLGLIVVSCVDSDRYGFGDTDFGTITTIQVKMGLVYDSIVIDEKNQCIVTVKNDKTIKKSF